jgi:hypothetical protein
LDEAESCRLERRKGKEGGYWRNEEERRERKEDEGKRRKEDKEEGRCDGFVFLTLSVSFSISPHPTSLSLSLSLSLSPPPSLTQGLAGWRWKQRSDRAKALLQEEADGINLLRSIKQG